MSIVHVWVEPSWTARIIVILLVLYLAWSIVSAMRNRHQRIAAVAVPLALTPLFLACAEAWLGLARVGQALSLVGEPSTAARAAGVAESEATLVFGAAIAAAVSLVAALRGRQKGDPPVAGSARSRRVQLAFAALCACTLIAEMSLAALGATTDASLLGNVPFLVGAAAFCTVAGLTSWAWLIVARMHNSYVDAGNGVVFSLFAAAFTTMLAFAGWKLVQRLSAIAITGHF